MKARENPFAMGRLERVRYRFAPGDCPGDDDWAGLLRRFDRLNRCAALVGAHGAGKTTLLEEFGDHWQRQGFRVFRFRLTIEQPHLPGGRSALWRDGFGSRDQVLLDGAEQLSWWDWRAFHHRTREAGGLLITTHRPGRLPTLLECRTSPELLAALAGELTRGSSRSRPDDFADLFRRHRGNLRDALRELYDVWSNAAASQIPTDAPSRVPHPG